jgi:hypothetical protein
MGLAAERQELRKTMLELVKDEVIKREQRSKLEGKLEGKLETARQTLCPSRV